MAIGRRVWGVGKALLLLSALAVTFVLAFLVSMRVAIRAGQVQIPNLSGMSVEDATSALQELELRPRIEEVRRPDAKIAAGRVVQQDPPAGEAARPQRTVKIWISAGARTTAVPALVGQTERTARLRTDQDGITITTTSEVHRSDYPPETIVAQYPAPPARGTQVSVLINRGDQATTYVMPDVIGMDGSRVEAALRNAGLRVTIVGSQSYPGVPMGTIVRQQPASGYQVGAADAISLEVSR